MGSIKSLGPVIFISSTVLDLGDLRSALKFWLEEFGFEVRTSEATDFPRPLDRGAAEAALATIEGSDYYLLIVGARRGSTFPGRDISVTHAELLEAQRLYSTTGRPQLLTFVRRSIDDLLRAHAQPREISASDWDGVAAILRSARDERLSSWVNSFETFRDIVDVLRATLKISSPMRRRALEANLLAEIRTNTAVMWHKEAAQGGIWPPPLLMEPSRVPDVVTHDDVLGDVVLTRAQTQSVLEYHLEAFGVPDRIVTIALDAAIASGEFLEFDAPTSALRVGQLQNALLQLRENITRLSETERRLEQQVDQLNRLDLRPNRGPTLSVRGGYIASLKSHGNVYMNVLLLNGALAQSLSGMDRPFAPPQLRHYSPRQEVARQIEATRLTEQDIDVVLGLTPPQVTTPT